jgi:hypothetical protein
MKRVLTVVAVSAALLASQAIAADSGLSVGDRVGSSAQTSTDLQGSDSVELLVGIGALAAFIYALSTIGGHPASP